LAIGPFAHYEIDGFGRSKLEHRMWPHEMDEFGRWRREPVSQKLAEWAKTVTFFLGWWLLITTVGVVVVGLLLFAPTWALS
jgi:hypothetical protein